MSSNLTLTAIRGNDMTFSFQVLLNERQMNLAGFTPIVYIKATAQTPDANAVTINTSTGITVTNSARGQLDVLVPATANVTPGNQWWRLDLIDTGHNNARITVLYGPYVILAV